MGRSGFVLLAALWLTVLIVGVAGSVLLPLRTSRLQARNVVTEAEASRTARSGIVHGLAVIEADLRRGADNRDAVGEDAKRLERIQLTFSGVGLSPAPGGGLYTISIADESARFPINMASEAELQRLLFALGVPHLRGIDVAAAIADWIDPDDLHRLNGAEWDDYYADQPGQVRPANAPLADISELRQIRGIDATLFNQLQPLLTVEMNSRVNLNSAPPPVLAGLPGLTDDAVQVILSSRRKGTPLRSLEGLANRLSARSRESLQNHYSDLRRRVQFRSRVFRLTSVGQPTGQGHSVSIEATVVIVGERAVVVRTVQR